MNSPLERARAVWGNPAPDWIEALAAACEATSQVTVATRLNRSAGLISQVLGRKYAGDMARIEDAVRGAYMAATIDCPALGTLPTDECQLWRARSKTFVNTNSLRVRMYRACLRCPRNPAAQIAADERT